MVSIRRIKSAGARYVRARIGREVPPADPHAIGVDRRRARALVDLYETLRTRLRIEVPPAGKRLPAPHDVEALQRGVLRGNNTFLEFFATMSVDANPDRALIDLHRKLIQTRRDQPSRARAMAQVLQQAGVVRPSAEVCLAISALREPVPGTTWQLLSRNDLAFVLNNAPVEYLIAALNFGFDPQAARAAFDRVASGEIVMSADCATWLEIGYLLFSAGFEQQSSYALHRADEALAALAEDDEARGGLQNRIDNLRAWHGRAASPATTPALPAGRVSVGLLGYEHPDVRKASDYAINQIETLTVLGHLSRHTAARFGGAPELVSVADQVRSDLAPDQRIAGAGSGVEVDLVPVHRDFSEFGALPQDTWLVVTSWFIDPLLDFRFDAPLNPNVRPVFVSVHMTEPMLARAGVVDYLKQHGPIGCMDWETVQLLQSAGVPAFFSGAITTTTGDVVGAGRDRAGAGTEVAFFDLFPDGGGQRRSARWHTIRERGFVENLRETRATIARWRETTERVVTTDLGVALTARSLGFTVDFRPDAPGAAAVGDLGSLSDAGFDEVKGALADKLAVLFGAIVAGGASEDVYAAWREACAADVAKAEARTAAVADLGTVDFDLDELCRRIRAGAVTVERTEQAGAGGELNIEFSLDAKYKDKLDIVLDSVVAHTERPVRAFILCRQHGPDDFERMARLFPMVSFVWLPTDDVDYGPIAGKIPWASIATMDRTLLPLILPEVDRIMHLDLDLLVLGDVAELFDTPFEGRPLVAVLEPQLCYRSGYGTVRGTTARHRRLGEPELATELMSRVVARHPFDFDVFNAGVMVMNLDRMRADEFCARMLPYVQRYGVNGQEVLNIYVGNDYVRQGVKWNRNARLEVLDDPADDIRIAHWAGPFKPWRSDHYVAGRELWRTAEARFVERTARLGDAVPAR